MMANRQTHFNPAEVPMFRFSLKWILAAMVYAAIAAAAFSQQTWVYADLLCGAALLALGYALLLVIYTRGPRQAAAAGFAVCMILIAAVVQISPDSVPTLRILTATGIGQPPILPTPTTPVIPPAAATFSTGTLSLTPGSIGTINSYALPNAPSGWRSVQSSSGAFSSSPPLDITLKLRAANAVTLMLAGLLGILLGLMAYRRAQRAESPTLASSR
jgi:hypothetical protein